MNYLYYTINSLTKEEIINYKLYSKRTQSNKKRKDILLFDLLKKLPDDQPDDAVFSKLYSESEDRGAYYRLKNRLLKEINSSLVQFYCFEENGHDVYSELSLSKIFIKKNNFQLANYHLLKAEKIGLASQNWSLLDIIYTELINLSTEYVATSPEEYIAKREKNQIQLKDTRTLDDSLAVVVYKLKRNQNQNVSHIKNDAEEILTNAISDLRNKKEYKNNLGFKTKLYNAVSRLLLSQQDFKTLEKYVLSTYKEFVKNKHFSKSNHDIKLQMLAYLCNTLFVNKKYEDSLQYIELLNNAMNEYKKMLYDKYVFFYYNSLVNNYTTTNPQKAITVLNAAKENKSINSHPTHLGYIYLNLAVAYFDLRDHKTALKNIIKLYQHKLFNTIDISFKIKIQIAEIIMRIENKDYEYALRLLENTTKNNRQLLIEHCLDYEIDFVQLLIALIKKYDFLKTKKTQDFVTNFCEKYINYNTQSMVDYRVWLKEKFNLTT